MVLPQPFTRRARIAVLDDDRTFLKLLEELLRAEGYEVFVSATWQTAGRVVQETQPDLVILDLVFDAQERGWAILDQLRRSPQTRSIPLLVCSAALSPRSPSQLALQAGGIRTLAKPFALNDLLLTLLALLHEPARAVAAPGTPGGC